MLCRVGYRFFSPLSRSVLPPPLRSASQAPVAWPGRPFRGHALPHCQPQRRGRGKRCPFGKTHRCKRPARRHVPLANRRYTASAEVCEALSGRRLRPILFGKFSNRIEGTRCGFVFCLFLLNEGRAGPASAPVRSLLTGRRARAGPMRLRACRFFRRPESGRSLRHASAHLPVRSVPCTPPGRLQAGEGPALLSRQG